MSIGIGYLLQPRVMAGSFGSYTPTPTSAILSLDVPGGQFVEGDTITCNVTRVGDLVAECTADVVVSGIPDIWMVDPPSQQVRFLTSQETASVTFRTRVVVSDQGTYNGTIGLANPVGCVLDPGHTNFAFQISDSTSATPPVLSVARTSAATIQEGGAFTFRISSSYLGLVTPATVDWAVTSSRDPADLSGTVTGTASIASTTDVVDLSVATAAVGGSQGSRTLTVTLTNPYGATIGTATATCSLTDATSPVELPNPVGAPRLVSSWSTFLDAVNGTGAWAGQGCPAGTHIVLADGTYTSTTNLVLTRSGTAAAPIVIRGANRRSGTTNGAVFQATVSVKADHVWFYQLNCKDGKNYNHQDNASMSTLRSSWRSQFAVGGANVRFMRCSFSWSKMVDTNRGGKSNTCHGVQYAYASQDGKLWRCEFLFTGPSGANADPSEIPSTPSTANANEIRPAIFWLKPNGNSTIDGAPANANNKGLEIAYCLFQGFPGGDWWDDVMAPIGGKPYGAAIGYDKLIRGSVMTIGGEQNDSLAAKTSNIDVHHNYVAGNGADMDFGATKGNGQGTCKLRANYNPSGDGIRLRVCQNWMAIANYCTGGRGLYGNYGPGHVYIGNYQTKDLQLRPGNCTAAEVTPYPPNTSGGWAASTVRWAEGNPRCTTTGAKFYGNRCRLLLGGGERYYINNGATEVTRKTGSAEVYGHKSTSGTPINAVDDNWIQVIPAGYSGTPTVSGSIPVGITVPTAVPLTLAQVGPDSTEVLD